jgi:hypothetical protein
VKYHQYRDVIAKLDLTQIEAADMFGVSERTSRRWALNERKIHRSVDLLLTLLMMNKIDIRDIERARKKIEAR